MKNKTYKNSSKRNFNKTKKNKANTILYYKPFEEKFEKKNKKITSSNYNLEKDVIKNLKIALNKGQISPNNDYYSYINERWLKNINLKKKQKYITQVDDFRLVQDKVYRELIEIIENFIYNKHGHNTNTNININTNKNKKLKTCMKNAYHSLQKFNKNKNTKYVAHQKLREIEEIINENNLWKLLAMFNKNEIISWACPFVWSINPDEKQPTIYKCYLEPPQLTLLDEDVYFDNSTDTEEDKNYKRKFRKVYFKYLNGLFTIALGKNHSFNVKDIYDCERELLEAMNSSCQENIAENEDGYNLITKSQSYNKYGFDWEQFCSFLGFKNIPRDFVTSNVNYLLCATKMLKEKWNQPSWKTYWIFIYIRQQCRWDEYGYKNFYDFQGNFIRGQEEIVHKYLRPIFPMGYMFNTFLTNEYIKQNKNEKHIQYVKALAEDLKKVFQRIIERNKWLQPNTKKVALEKLESIRLIIGSPSILREDPLLDYVSSDSWVNLVKISHWRHKNFLSLVDKPIIDIPIIDWTQIPPKFVSTQAYVVNAMYTPTDNSIYIPLAYLQKPFIDLDERGIEYNLAYIGFTIAHEMSHSLDDWGSQYDKHGKLHNWWTNQDRKYFEEEQKNIVKQYETFAAYDNIKFDAWPSIGEDLADITGFAICQEYLRDFQMKNEDILPIINLSFEAFFIYFALQSRQKISKKAILAQLKSNPHPLDKYRCNIPLSRSRIFRTIYNVQKKDKMWWSNFSNVWTD
jgi:putative endopeptidase